MSTEIINGRLEGTRITVYDIVHYLEGGWSPSLVAQVLRLPLEKVQAAGLYIEEHRDEVMPVHREIEERIARGNPPHIEALLETSHEKLMRLVEERRKTNGEVGGAGHPR